MPTKNASLAKSLFAEIGSPRKTAHICGSLFLAFLMLYAVNAYFNYSTAMDGDIYDYIQGGKALLRGNSAIQNPLYSLLVKQFPDITPSLTYLEQNPAGRSVSFCTIGIHLIFAPAIALFGNNIFWVLPVLSDILLLICLFFTIRLYFKAKGSSLSWIMALAGISLYGFVVNFRLNLRRDTFCASILMLATLAVLLALKKRRWLFWHFGFALICFATIVKVNMALVFVPFFILFFRHANLSDLNRRQIIGHSLATGFIGALIFVPFFIQNHFASGHWYLPIQILKEMEAFYPPGHVFWGRFLLSNFIHLVKAQAYIFGLDGFPLWTAIFCFIGALAGLWSERKNPFVRTWGLLFLVAFYGFYVTNDRNDFVYNIYLAPTYPLVVFLVICGFDFLTRRVRNKRALWWVLAVFFLVPFAAVKTYRSLPEHRYARFQLQQTLALGADLEKIMPPGSVLFCDKFLSFSVSNFTGIYCFPPHYLESRNSTACQKTAYLLSRNIPVYFCDYRGTEYAYTYRDILKKQFQLRLITKNQSLYDYDVRPVSIYQVCEGVSVSAAPR
ncbi:MAG: glycosyltransferase family 39 protein [Chitinivibrionales bacterium]|nr:glycosyltransferase family 39 protein [Chitinivibrionales bacterium]